VARLVANLRQDQQDNDERHRADPQDETALDDRRAITNPRLPPTKMV